MDQRFNLIDENWIPVATEGRVSLKRIFSDPTLEALGGNAIQKLAIIKILLAIAQRASTPKDSLEWKLIGADGMAKKCLVYLEANKDLFWLFGDKPFLQMPILREMIDKNGNPLPVQEIGRNYMPDLPSDNDSILFQTQINHPLSDAEKAVFLISIMNYSPGGKRTAKNVKPLSKGYTGKSNSAKPSPSLGTYHGYLNSFILGDSIIDTIYLNLFTFQDLEKYPQWEQSGLIPPWEEMPKGEDDPIAKRLKNSFISTLCSLSRFVLLVDNGIIYVEGLQYPSHIGGWREPFIASTNDGKMLWLDTSKKPWRNVIAFLNLAFNGNDTTYNCPQISLFFTRARSVRNSVGVWSGGLQVRGTAGDQSVKQTDDFIESFFFVKSSVNGEFWFQALKAEMVEIDNLSKSLYVSISNYLSDQNYKKNKGIVNKAVELFWQLCERDFQDLVDNCDNKNEIYKLRKNLAEYALEVYDRFCPNNTARQMFSWAKNRPDLKKYLIKKEGGNSE